ncbi:MAG: thiamine pyrophosphate-binding protein [Planctomycetaceae bacterium]|nr:thiamine pyrophosphate-binding protein [Planctomycetaceae bacterium]
MNMTAAQAVVKILEEQGTRVVFGIPGGQTIFLNDALNGSSIRFVATRHEGGAGHAADGWGRLTGQPGVCLATTGPGATNMVTPLGGALRDSTPLIALLFQNKLPDVGRGDAQDANHEAIFSSLVKAFIPVRHVSAVPWAVREAYRIAMSGRPGPVVLDFYRDVIEDPSANVSYTPMDPSSYCATPQVLPTADALQKAAGILTAAKRVCILSGNGVKMAKAGDTVLAVAEALNAPIVTSFNGIGSVPTDHDLVLGARTRHGSTVTRGALEGADCVLVLGSSLSAVGTNRWTLDFKNVVQIDFETKNLGRQYPVSCGLAGEIGLTLDALLPLLANSDAAAQTSRKKWLGTQQAARAAWRDKVFSGAWNDDSATPATPVATIRAIDAQLKPDGIVCIDAGNPGAWSHLLTIKKGMTYMKPVNYGNMGFSVTAGLACSLAEPSREVISILGDGSLGMSLGELETLARCGVNQIVVVLNDSAYGNIRQEERFKFGDDVTYNGVDLSSVDFATVAKGLGMGAETVKSAKEISAAFANARKHQGPYLINVIFDGSYSIWPEAF